VNPAVGRPTSPGWETVEDGERAYLRTSLPGRGQALAPFAIARRLADRYEVGQPLAVGEATIVLRAEDSRTGHPVAIKTLRLDAVPEPPPGVDPGMTPEEAHRRLRHQLQTERRILVRLRNAGIDGVPHPDDYVFDRVPDRLRPAGCPPLDALLGPTDPYLILEYLAGPTLDGLVARDYPRGMREGLALAILAPVVAILGALHEPWRLAGGRVWHCVYQDLKPSNILIGPLGRPTLIDFAGCQVVVDGVLVLEGASTAGYAPPEAAQPGRVLLPGADVFSIGATLLHLLTGRPPDPSGRPSDPPRSTSPPVRQFLDRCLAPRPSDRFASAIQVGRAFASMGIS